MLTHKLNAHTGEDENTHRLTHTNALSSGHKHLYTCNHLVLSKHLWETNHNGSCLMLSMSPRWRWNDVTLMYKDVTYCQWLSSMSSSSDRFHMKLYEISYRWKCGLMFSGQMPEEIILPGLSHPKSKDLDKVLDISSFTNMQFINIPVILQSLVLVGIIYCTCSKGQNEWKSDAHVPLAWFQSLLLLTLLAVRSGGIEPAPN